jgi:hypothetical protein
MDCETFVKTTSDPKSAKLVAIVNLTAAVFEHWAAISDRYSGTAVLPTYSKGLASAVSVLWSKNGPNDPPAIVRQAEADLAQLAEVINASHIAGEEAMRDGLEHFRRSGEALIQARDRCKRDGIRWLPWLGKNVRFSQRTAYNYIDLAEGWEKVATVATLRDALRLLARDAADEEEAAAIREVRNDRIRKQIESQSVTEDDTPAPADATTTGEETFDLPMNDEPSPAPTPARQEDDAAAMTGAVNACRVKLEEVLDNHWGINWDEVVSDLNAEQMKPLLSNVVKLVEILVKLEAALDRRLGTSPSPRRSALRSG